MIAMLGCGLLFLALSTHAMGQKAAARPEIQIGIASWYGSAFSGLDTSSGAHFNPHLLTAASRHFQLGSVVRVTNLRNGRQVKVLINDRGPFVRGRILDLSRTAARMLHMLARGLARVRIRLLYPPGRRARITARKLFATSKAAAFKPAAARH